MKYISSAATAIGTMLMMITVPPHGVLNIKKKHHVLMFVKIINLNKCMNTKEYIKSYPYESYTGSVDADKLAEGRIYLAETPGVETRLERSYICVKQASSFGHGVVLHFGIYFELNGTLVHISDPHVENYQSVASSRYANFIHKNVGIRRLDDYHFFIPSQSQVMNALDILGSLGYEFVDGEIRKKKK